MRFVKVFGKYGPFYGLETEEKYVLVWEEGCYQKFPIRLSTYGNEVEEITPLEFYRWMSEHCKLMIEEDRT